MPVHSEIVTACFKRFSGPRLEYWTSDALPTLLAGLPATAKEHFAHLDVLITECARQYKQMRKYADHAERVRPKTYVKPTFPAPYQGLVPTEVELSPLGEQALRNYTASIGALDLALMLHPLLWPASPVQGVTLLFTDYDQEVRKLQVPKRMSQARFDAIVNKAKDRTCSVEDDHFNQSLFFLLLQRAGVGVSEPQELHSFSTLMSGRLLIAPLA